MKTLKLLGLFMILSIFSIISSCDSEGEDLEPIPDNPTGSYNYTGHSEYFYPSGALDYETAISGSANLQFIASGNSILISIIPMIGYEYQVQGTNLKNHGDTTTFTIARQQVNIRDRTFTFEGTNSVDVGSLGRYDGFFTSKSFQLQYHSVDIGSLNTTDTYIDATKRN